ncbi:hypothetical protein AKJ18_06940 [Vibrio xuii]|nr:hypothetical protein AKJ18_06940 [Vibrio xuii]
MKHTNTDEKCTTTGVGSLALLCLSFCALLYSTPNFADDGNVEGPLHVAPDIVGGTRAKRGQFPFMSRLLPRNAPTDDKGNCGATLIHPRYVLTAFHCVESSTAKGLSVQVGAYDLKAKDGERINVKNVFYPKWKPLGGYYGESGEYIEAVAFFDYAVLELSKPSKYPVIELMSPQEFTLVKPGELTKTMGWGINDSIKFPEQKLTASTEDVSEPDHVLNYVNVPYVDLEVCKAVGGPYASIGKESICVGFKEGEKGPCFGDSGGPLLAVAGDDKNDLKQVGIVSWGAGGCAQPEKYAVYASIPYHLEHIERLKHNISYTQDYYELKLSNQSRHVERLDYKNYRESAVQLGTPTVDEQGKVIGNTCPRWLAPNQECYVDVEWKKRDKQSELSGRVTMPILTPELKLISAIQLDYVDEAPSYYKKVLGYPYNLFSFGADWEIDEDIFSEGVSSLSSPKLKKGEESVIAVKGLPPGLLTFDIRSEQKATLESLQVSVNGVLQPIYYRDAPIEGEFNNASLILAQDKNDVLIIYSSLEEESATVWLDALESHDLIKLK